MSDKDKRVVVGLTGNISSGKSTILNIFSRLGCKTISSDDLAHQILEENEQIKGKVFKYFATTDRARLAEIVFTSAKKRILLETILHPEITNAIENCLEKMPCNTISIIEIPLLFETGWDKKVDYVIFVSCPTEMRKKRFYSIPDRKFGDFECRDTAQLSEAKKAQLSSFVIDNSKDLTNTEKQVKELLKRIKKDIG